MKPPKHSLPGLELVSCWPATLPQGLLWQDWSILEEQAQG